MATKSKRPVKTQAEVKQKRPFSRQELDFFKKPKGRKKATGLGTAGLSHSS
jgi:hypothetical protein